MRYRRLVHGFSLAAILMAGVSRAQVVVSSLGNSALLIQNAASRSLANYSDVGLAPGEWFVISGGPLPYAFDVAKASLQMTADGKKTTLPVSAPNGGNLQARLPVDLQAATVDLQLTYDSQPSDVATIAVKPTSFGLYTKWGTGTGPASAQNDTLGGPGPNSLVTPANPGEFVTLYGTGLGAARDVVVLVDGITVTPRYVGSAPGMAGVDQINFLMPAAGVRTVCYVPIRVQGAGWVSNEVTISVANVGGTCTHPLQLTPTAMAHLETGGTVPVAQASVYSGIGTVSATNAAPQYQLSESASVNLWWVNEQTVDAIGAPMQAQISAGCSATATAGTTYSALLSAPPDAGKTINLSRLGGNTIAMPSNNGYYSTAIPVSTAQSIDALPPSNFPAATWTLSAPGGADVQGFGVGLAVPPPINWTNWGQLGSISRSQDLLLTWDTTGLSEGDWMTATLSQMIVLASVLDPTSGSSPTSSSANTFTAPLVSVACRVPATSGRLTIGSTFLSAFPADPGPLELTLRLSPRPDLQSVAPIHPVGSGDSGAVIFTYQRELTQSVSMH